MVFEIIGFVIALIILSSAIRLIYQYERGVIFTLGKYSHVLNPGLNFIIPIIQTMRKVDMRIKTAEIPRQEVMTKDNIPLLANAVVYFKVERPEDVIIKIEDFEFAVKQFTQAALRDVIGNAELDSETSGWGINIESIKIQEIE